jgi:hypothetical protein
MLLNLFRFGLLEELRRIINLQNMDYLKLNMAVRTARSG